MNGKSRTEDEWEVKIEDAWEGRRGWDITGNLRNQNGRTYIKRKDGRGGKDK
jgi:hypothetical protein